MSEHIRYNRNRREFLSNCFCGMGSLAFASMMAQEHARAATTSLNPLAAKPPQIADHAPAKSMIFLFMAGGPSHLETFDPKPLLNKLDGQKRPAAFGDVQYQNVNSQSRLLGTKRTFKKYGKSGIEISDLFPHQTEIADELCVIRSMHGDMVVHSAAQYQMMTGRIIPGFPAMGSWIVYGLGSEADNLPAYVVMPDSHGAQEAGVPMYTNGFLPSVYQPTMFRPGAKPVLNLALRGGGPEAEWDAHSNIEENHGRMAAWTDKPVAALIKDLKRRGLLDSTIVLWGGEFGRSPESEKGNGRDHHNTGFSMWVAGGGFKGGTVYGATDDIGLKATENPVHFRDLHTTLLYQLGLNQDALSFMHLGRKERLTEVRGEVIKGIVT